jgi:hypothetical protein
MPFRSFLRAMVGALALAAMPVARLLAADTAAEAMARMISSQEAVFEVLDTIQDAAGLEHARPSLTAALDESEAAALALAEHAAELDSSEELQAEFTPKLQGLYELAGRVQGELQARLDPATMQAIEAILSGGQ